MSKRQQEIWDVLMELNAEDILTLITDHHGLRLLDEEFYEFLQDEGII
ncbi:hypothetical protein SDC9_198974 [bioreactor metagenome]|uniref:Uncharacterized protein n=1 Tax=bioreactor metagenome TaxID=1076179 RepID=A0A645IJ66_9ZZZZ